MKPRKKPVNKRELLEAELKSATSSRRRTTIKRLLAHLDSQNPQPVTA